jgi:hypothetical protein
VSLKTYAIAPLALLIGGVIVALVAKDSTAGIALAMTLIGIAAVVAVALAFYAIGRAEDRDREQAAAARRERAPEPQPEPPPEGHEGTEHPRTLGLGPERRLPRPPRRPQ